MQGNGKRARHICKSAAFSAIFVQSHSVCDFGHHTAVDTDGKEPQRCGRCPRDACHAQQQAVPSARCMLRLHHNWHGAGESIGFLNTSSVESDDLTTYCATSACCHESNIPDNIFGKLLNRRVSSRSLVKRLCDSNSFFFLAIHQLMLEQHAAMTESIL